MIRDHDNPIKSELIGTIEFDLKEYLPQNGVAGPLNGRIMWRNIYGSPIQKLIDLGRNKFHQKMNSYPDIASLWKGRILTQVICEPTTKPVCKIQSIKDLSEA